MNVRNQAAFEELIDKSVALNLGWEADCPLLVKNIHVLPESGLT